MKYVLSLSLLVCICLISCKSQDVTQKSSNTRSVGLSGTKWVLTELNGDPVNLASAELEQPFIILTDKDKSVAGNGGCNGFGGTYTTMDNQTVSFSQILATMRYCEDHGIESVFISNLQKATSYVITDDELTLKDENGYVLISFEPATEKMQ